MPTLLCVTALASGATNLAAAPTAQTFEKVEWSTAKGRLGMTVMSLTPELREHFRAPADRGVIVSHVDPGTPAASAGIQVGDVILEVQGQKIDAAPDVLAALAAVGKGEHAKIQLVRDGATRALEATLTDSAFARAMWSPLWLDPADWIKPLAADPAPTTSFADWLESFVQSVAAPKAGPVCTRS